MTKEKAPQSIIDETKTLIHRREGKYAWSVINDFEDALRAGDDRHKVAYRWLQEYKTGKRTKRIEKPAQPKAEGKPFPKQPHKEWTDYKPTGNKFAEMWHQTNILTGQYKFPASVDKKMKALKRLIELVDTATKTQDGYDDIYLFVVRDVDKADLWDFNRPDEAAVHLRQIQLKGTDLSRCLVEEFTLCDGDEEMEYAGAYNGWNWLAEFDAPIIKDHFRMTLCQILRDEPNQDIRREAIYLLAQCFKWSEIEWTFWAHEKRQPKDCYILIGAEAFCKSKTKDAKALEQAVAMSTRQFLADVVR